MKSAKTSWDISWSLRAEVEQARHRLALPESQFRPLKVNEWHDIEEKVYKTFCGPNSPSKRPVWLWFDFKLDTHSYFSYKYLLPDFILEKLVDNEEIVWLMLNESGSGAGKKIPTWYLPHNGPPEGIWIEYGSEKFWFYEGRVKAIQQVLEDSAGIDEIYIISKKYEWLLCINHHDVLYATGGPMPARLRHLEATGALTAST
ncbi:MAG: DUF6756 family protein [Janthinobacterium lividum]